VIAGLLDHLWQSTLFAGAVALAMPLFRRQAAALRFWLWFAASMKFLFPFALLMMLGRRILSAMTPAAAEPVLAMIRPAAAPFAAIAASLAAPAPTHVPAMDLAVVVWSAGLVAIALHCLSRWLDLRATLKEAGPVAMDAPVPVKSAPSFIEPGLVGIWRPVILLPAGLTQHLTPAELDAVLAHELCHLRRRDNLLAALHMLVEGLFWFHPLTWRIGNRLCEERERACDESVVAGGVRPLVYAEGILKTCRFYVQSPLACASGVSGADLKLRVTAIMADQPVIMLHPAKAMLLALTGTAALMLPLSAGLLGSAPATQIATHIATLLATREEAPVAPPAMLMPDIAISRHSHRRLTVTKVSSVQPEASMLVRTPAIQVDTVLDTHLPAISVPVMATAPEAEDAIVCRKPQRLADSRLPGPAVCLHASQWARLHAGGQDISPDGRSLVSTDYEKQKTLVGSSCPAPMNVGASTGWHGGSTDCF
jgi:beta-lactamase regulating signal transducer with metallopeptidase domain